MNIDLKSNIYLLFWVSSVSREEVKWELFLHWSYLLLYKWRESSVLNTFLYYHAYGILDRRRQSIVDTLNPYWRKTLFIYNDMLVLILLLNLNWFEIIIFIKV